MTAELEGGRGHAIPRSIALVVAVIGVAITLAAAYGVSASVERRIVERFNEIATARAERIEHEFDRYHDELVTIAQHLRGVEGIDNGSLERFGRRTETLPHIRALMLFDASVGALADVGAAVKNHRSALFPEQVVRFADGSATPPQEEHVEWAQRRIFGPPYIATQPRLSEPLHTSKFPYEPALYQAAVPLLPSGADNPQVPRGFLVGVYRPQAIIEEVMRAAPNPLALRIIDLALPVGRNLLAVYDRPAESPRFGNVVYSTNLKMGERVWEVTFMPTNALVAKHGTNEPLLVLLLGFSLTFAAATAALLSARWRLDIMALVARRTAELEAAEARQRAVVANMADALVLTDGAGVIESLNEAAQRLFGWAPSELVGKPLSVLLSEECVGQFETAFANGEAVTSRRTARGKRRDGDTFPLGVSLSAVASRSGTRRIALMRDLFRERAAERAMGLFIAGTAQATGKALLLAVTGSLAQALGVRGALVARACDEPGSLQIVSLWCEQQREAGQRYPLVGEPCAEVLGKGLRCYPRALPEIFPHSRWSLAFQAQSYIGHPLHAADGTALGLVALFHSDDIEQPALAESLLSMAASRIAAEIERMQSDAALLASRERLELAVEGSQLALWDLNVTTGEVYLSPRWSVMLGGQERITHTTLARLHASVHPDDRNALDIAYRDALRGVRPFYETMHRVQRADGSWMWVRSHGKVTQRDADARALRLVGTNADVTWEKTAAEEVERRERELRTISDNVPATIARLDRQLRFLYANRRYTAMLGMEADALTGRTLGEVLGNVAYQEVLPHFEHALTGEIVTFDREIGPGTRRRWIAITIIPDVNAEWDVQGVFCIGLDVTERKELEQRMRDARTNAEAAARAKSEFLATMSHEIRTPMNGVLGLAGLLLDSGLTVEQQGYAETLHRSAISLLEILNDVLDMSKIEAGKLELEPIPFELAAAVEDVAALWAPKAASKSLELAVSIDSSCPRSVIGDAGRVRQVLGNLVGNAIKFTSVGHVLIRVSAGHAEDNQILFEVEDSGIGIDPSVRRHLFEPFSQADGSTTRRFGGSGLGLAICRRLVQLMEGSIGVDGVGPKGSRFWFTARLPADGGVPAPAPAEFADVRVLLVEDHPVARMVLRKQLHALGMRVTCAVDAEDAWERLRALPAGEVYDVAVLDYPLHDREGMELSARLRADARWRTLPLILLSAASPQAEGAVAPGASPLRWLMKPARSKSLQRFLLAALERRGAQELLPAPVPAHDARARFSGRVLLVEDNEVNRRVAIAVLGKLGLQVDAAANGLEALVRSAESDYDLILMDVHMSEMDGLAAARAIRDREAGGARHVPIVAMTANVLAEARGACFDAGMDDFLPKPFLREDLLRTLSRWLPERTAAVSDAPVGVPAESAVSESAGAAVSVPAGSTPSVEEPVLDAGRLAALREAMGDDISELIGVFLASTHETVASLRATLARDRETLHRYAHTLKASAANVGAVRLSALARKLESSAREAEETALEAAIEKIEQALYAVEMPLRAAADASSREASLMG